MSSAIKRERIERGSWLMTAYHFAYVVIYQSVVRHSFDKYVGYRSALLLGMFQIWLTGVVCLLIGRLVHAPGLPPRPVWFVLALGTGLAPYFAIYQNGSWRDHEVYFKQWPRRQLVIGRTLFLATVAVVITLTFTL